MYLPLKDLEKEHSIPDVWKDSICEVVIQLTKNNFELHDVSEYIALQSSDMAKFNRENVLEYGCCLKALSTECWERSCYQWQGNYRDLIIDLCTVEEDVSDLVLKGRVYPINSGYKYEFGMVHVP
tara:strand:- start:702 stop:1076 length:375 start_codon:yes stop_codon:yes gene_type:complete